MTSLQERDSLELKDKDGVYCEEESVNPVPEEDPQWKKREARVLRKLDIFIGPYLALLMILSHLDRSNIGFATTQGMAVDIGLRGTQLNVRKSAIIRNREPLTCSLSRENRLPSRSSTSSTSWLRSQQLCSSRDFSSTSPSPAWLSPGVWSAWATDSSRTSVASSPVDSCSGSLRASSSPPTSS